MILLIYPGILKELLVMMVMYGDSCLSTDRLLGDPSPIFCSDLLTMNPCGLMLFMKRLFLML